MKAEDTQSKWKKTGLDIFIEEKTDFKVNI